MLGISINPKQRILVYDNVSDNFRMISEFWFFVESVQDILWID